MTHENQYIMRIYDFMTDNSTYKIPKQDTKSNAMKIIKSTEQMTINSNLLTVKKSEEIRR